MYFLSVHVNENAFLKENVDLISVRTGKLGEQHTQRVRSCFRQAQRKNRNAPPAARRNFSFRKGNRNGKSLAVKLCKRFSH